MYALLSVKQFFRDLRSQKLRTFMTMFGILWGTVSIILLMAFGTGMQEFQQKRFKGLGENICIFWPGVTSKPWNGLPRGRHIRFVSEDATRIREMYPVIKHISPEFPRSNVMLKSHKNNLTAQVIGVWPEFHKMRNIIPAAGGRFINDKDMEKKRRTIFIGDRLAEQLFAGEDPVGQTLQVRGAPFVVVGVMVSKDQNSSYGGRDNRNAYIASETFLTMFSRRYPNNMVIQSTNDNNIQEAIDSFKSYMAAKYNFDPTDTETLGTWDVTEGFKFITNFFVAFRMFLLCIGCLTLVTAGIGVTNIMNVVLEERTKEIGIKMALGAKKRTIMSQFMFETVLLTCIGGSIGFIIAYAIVMVFPLLNLTEHIGTPTIHVFESVMTISILGIVAFLSGFFPARRASNMEPVKALKLF
ncbi:MAG: ABC transporter permease [candidate division Zixibacteria bacterium]|nr:ABC transporter permease [candidate division Zixibacteria bacterium]